MKKKILFFLILAVLFSACKMKLSENIGTVIIDFGGNERAVDENGLPYIKDASMNLEINSASHGTQKIDIAAGQTKTWSGTFPAGEKLTIKVSLSTASAVWKGSTEHTVTEGANSVSIKLKKTIAALNSLLFSKEPPTTPGTHNYTLTLKIGSKEIKKENIEHHSFCRDNKGRTYLTYSKGAGAHHLMLERYTSEGEIDIAHKQIDASWLAYDYAAGKLYGLNGRELKEIDDALNTHEVTSADVRRIFAVDNGRLITGSLRDGFYLSKIGSKNKNYIAPSAFESYVHPFGLENLNLNEQEFFIRGDYLYILLSGFHDTSPRVYSLGAVIKWKLGEKEVMPPEGGASVMLPHLIGEPVLIGKPKGQLSFVNHVLKGYDYSKNFYGTIKVIGFDDENIYIADDGFDAADTPAGVHVVKNRNRIAMLNTETNSLTFTDAGTAKWDEERKEWKAPNTKTLVWKKNSQYYDGFSYYQLNQPDDTPSSEQLLKLDSNGTPPGQVTYFTDVFCYDQEGNFYIIKTDISGHKICRFELKDDGSYDRNPKIAGEGTPHIINIPNSPDAIAVGKSGTQNLLYYSYDSGGAAHVQRLKWSNSFDGAENDAGFNFPSQHSKKITALAANKDGLFAALKSEDGNGYTVDVQKYAHTGSAVGTAIQVLNEATNASGWSRPGDLTALHIHEGFLYGLTAVQYRYDWNVDSSVYCKDSISGKLLKIGKSTADFTGRPEELYSSQPENLHAATDEQKKEGGKFAPYRFIAVKPRKLVVASDGFWGYITDVANTATDDVEQFNFIWDFSIKADGSLEGTPTSKKADSAIEFSKKLTRQSGSSFDWR